MGWKDKFKLPDLGDITDKAKEATKGLLGSEEPAEQKQAQEKTDLEAITDMLNNPQHRSLFEQQLGMNISGALEKDGVITKDETVNIIAELSQKLVKNGYLKDVNSKQKSALEIPLREELGEDVGSYDTLSTTQKDALLIFVATPESQRQEAIQKAVQDGGLSQAPTQDVDADINTVLVEPNSGNVIDLQNPISTETQAYTEEPTVPTWINSDSDIG